MERMQGERAMIANMQGGPAVTVVQQGPPVIPATALAGEWRRTTPIPEACTDKYPRFFITPAGENLFNWQLSPDYDPGNCCVCIPRGPQEFTRSSADAFDHASWGTLRVIDLNTMRQTVSQMSWTWARVATSTVAAAGQPVPLSMQRDETGTMYQAMHG